jgi:hypothetical protein
MLLRSGTITVMRGRGGVRGGDDTFCGLAHHFAERFESQNKRKKIILKIKYL